MSTVNCGNEGRVGALVKLFIHSLPSALLVTAGCHISRCIRHVGCIFGGRLFRLRFGELRKVWVVLDHVRAK